jgi:DNA phosphorothioation-dependent restriction protein DptG
MGNADFNDGDANAAAMAALHAKTDAERAKEREAIEKKAARRVGIKAGELFSLLDALEQADAFAQRYVNVKEHGVRVTAINIVARDKPLLEAVRKKIPEYVAGGRGPAT